MERGQKRAKDFTHEVLMLARFRHHLPGDVFELVLVPCSQPDKSFLPQATLPVFVLERRICCPLTLHLHFRARPVSAIISSLTPTFQTSTQCTSKRCRAGCPEEIELGAVILSEVARYSARIQDTSAYSSQCARVDARSDNVLRAAHH